MENLFTHEMMNNEILLITGIKGELTLNNAARILTRVQKIIFKLKPLHLIMDMNDISYIDSSGVGFLLSVKKLISTDCNNIIILINMNKRIKDIMDTTNLLLSGMIKSADNVDNALKILNEQL